MKLRKNHQTFESSVKKPNCKNDLKYFKYQPKRTE